MKLLKAIFGSLAVVLLMSGAVQAQDTYELPMFHSIDTRGNIHLIVMPRSDKYTISAEEYGEGKSKFDFTVKKGVLYLTLKTGIVDKETNVRAVVTVSELKSITSQGSMVEMMVPSNATEFSYQTKGSYNMAKLKLNCQNAEISASGESDIVVSGEVHRLELKASASARIDALNTKYTELDAHANSTSEIYIHSQGNISNAKASTGGTIYYYGSDKNLFKKISLGGGIVSIATPQIEAHSPLNWNNDEQQLKQHQQPKEDKKESNAKKNEPKKEVQQKVEVEDGEDFF